MKVTVNGNFHLIESPKRKARQAFRGGNEGGDIIVLPCTYMDSTKTLRRASLYVFGSDFFQVEFLRKEDGVILSVFGGELGSPFVKINDEGAVDYISQTIIIPRGASIEIIQNKTSTTVYRQYKATGDGRRLARPGEEGADPAELLTSAIGRFAPSEQVTGVTPDAPVSREGAVRFRT